MRTIVLSMCLVVNALTSAIAEEVKFKIDGDTLFYNTETTDAVRDYITYADATRFRELLSANPEITRVELFSYGGKSEAGLEIGRILSDFKITTVVSQECSSACISIYLAGTRRELKPGAILGFHRPEWAVDAMKSFYNNEREQEGWITPFSFASWLQNKTFYLAGQIFEEYLNAGVDFTFAKEALRIPHENMWYPTREILENAGVVTRQSTLVSSITPRVRPGDEVETESENIQISQAN